MKILYAVQATGNGHIARALELGPALEQYAEVDYLLSGSQGDIDLGRPIRHRRRGASFVFGKDGGIDIMKSLGQAAPIQLLRDIRSVPINDYDIIVNDFEPITAWAARHDPDKIIAVSHQAAFASRLTPRPQNRNHLAELVMKYYAPCQIRIGLHFEAYDDTIMTPIIRKKIRALHTSTEGHVTVYLPAYDSTYLVNIFQHITDVQWHIYSKHHRGEAVQVKNCKIYPTGHEDWYQSLAEAEGVVLGAGFEGPSEPLCLGKKLLVIPMRNQYEQQCNAAALEQLGVTTLPHLKPASTDKLSKWLRNVDPITIRYPDHTEQIVAKVLDRIKSSEAMPILV